MLRNGLGLAILAAVFALAILGSPYHLPLPRLPQSPATA